MIDYAIERVSRYWRVFTLLMLAVITLASLWPLAQLPAVPGSDKTHHLIAYAALVIPVALARPKRWRGLVALMLLWSGAIELVQPLANRYGEWLDLVANGAGLVLGIALVALWRRCRRQARTLADG